VPFFSLGDAARRSCLPPRGHRLVDDLGLQRFAGIAEGLAAQRIQLLPAVLLRQPREGLDLGAARGVVVVALLPGLPGLRLLLVALRHVGAVGLRQCRADVLRTAAGGLHAGDGVADRLRTRAGLPCRAQWLGQHGFEFGQPLLPLRIIQAGLRRDVEPRQHGIVIHLLVAEPDCRHLRQQALPRTVALSLQRAQLLHLRRIQRAVRIRPRLAGGPRLNLGKIGQVALPQLPRLPCRGLRHAAADIVVHQLVQRIRAAGVVAGAEEVVEVGAQRARQPQVALRVEFGARGHVDAGQRWQRSHAGGSGVSRCGRRTRGGGECCRALRHDDRAGRHRQPVHRCRRCAGRQQGQPEPRRALRAGHCAAGWRG